MWARSHSKEEALPGSLEPRARPLVSVHVACLSLPNWGKEGPERAGYLPKVTQETVARGLRTSEGFRLGPPPSSRARAPPICSSACGGARIPPAVRPSASRLSGWLRGRSPAPLPSPGRCAGRGRAFVAPGARAPTPHAPRPQPTDGSACARARAPPAGAREPPGQSRGGRPAARSLAPSLALCSQGKASREAPVTRPPR